MNFAALIATMVALASPNAHGPIKIDCVPMNFGGVAVGGVAIPWEDRIQLSPDVCRLNFRAILHRNVTPLRVEIGVMDLLHEAAHVGQWREGDRLTDPARRYEHDAECRALSGLPRALRTLKYRLPFVKATVSLARRAVALEPAPYGGPC